MSEPAAPESVTPESVTPEPLVPEPLAPEPLVPEPLAPEPLALEPGPARYQNGRFGPGNPGRPLGSRNRMSKRIALGILSHYQANEAEILEKLNRFFFPEYIRLIGRMLPRPPAADAPDLETMSPFDVARVTAEVRLALARVEAGEASLAELEAALVGAVAATVDYDANTVGAGAW